MVREGRALGEPGRAGRVLDVDRLVEVELGLARRERRCVVAAAREELVPLGAEQDALRVAPGASHGRDELDVVGVLEPGREDQDGAAGLVQRVLELVAPVRRVDVDEDRADLRGRELHDHPLGAVRRPDPDPVASDDAGREQAASAAVDLGAELCVGPADPLVARDDRFGLPGAPRPPRPTSARSSARAAAAPAGLRHRRRSRFAERKTNQPVGASSSARSGVRTGNSRSRTAASRCTASRATRSLATLRKGLVRGSAVRPARPSLAAERREATRETNDPEQRHRSTLSSRTTKWKRAKS